ncbi:hypothetical protein EV191_105313 [Tamaricihabitans halophyticus]|uniref:Lipoprotein n=1 Tax=Tamaricihabitans halophyticus TaxID=1262583 RepID=A0A4V2SU60_9PSEU|nr:hypothetical protein [Tamaricihabitans halophyticus]TCP53246.1 hypothetical protein EV191_105313 [Tamaricihabitans halophyticus]
MRRTSRPAIIAVVLAAVSLLAASCAHSVEGGPVLDEQSVRDAAIERFNEVIGNVHTYIRQDRSARAREQWTATVNEQHRTSDNTHLYHGDPPTTLVKRGAVSEGTNLDLFHPAGSNRDYLLLGEHYRKLAPTPWVTLPTSYDGAINDVCLLPGKMGLCKMIDSISLTAKEGGPNITKMGYRNPDGSVNLLSNVTVENFIDSRVILFPDDIKNQLTPKILESQLSARVDLTKANRVTFAQINGTITDGDKKFDIDITHEVEGNAQPGDFPTTPSGAELTVIKDDEKANALLDKALQMHLETR